MSPRQERTGDKKLHKAYEALQKQGLILGEQGKERHAEQLLAAQPSVCNSSIKYQFGKQSKMFSTQPRSWHLGKATGKHMSSVRIYSLN